MDDSNPPDILLVEPHESTRQLWGQAFIEHLGARVNAHSSARSALTSFMRARFDAVVCGIHLDDADCWRFIRMVRSGRFGYSYASVFVICAPEERGALSPLLDPHTALVDRTAASEMALHIGGCMRRRHKARVLIVEDEDQAAEAARRALNKYYEIEVAYNGQEGLDAWLARRHDLILLDLMLPGLPGREVLKRVMEEKADQPVIVLTAHDALEQHRDLVLAGAAEFLSKPFDLHFLASSCERVLHDSRCLENFAYMQGRATAFNEIAARVHAADYLLRRGRTAETSFHLVQALQACRTQTPTDDQWSLLLNEFAPQQS